MSRVVHLHVGAPKTGTTYLQDRLSANAAALAARGVHFPARSRLADADLFHFRAALDLLGQDWGGPRGHAAGSWDVMARKVRKADGTSIISHEILAPARPDVVARAVRDLGEAEVHVVYTARDLGRQLPAAWQESIKQGRTWSFRKFLDRTEQGRTWFAKAFDLPQVLTTWGSHLPPERIHLVTVPQPPLTPGTAPDPDLLWRRFCQAVGIDPAWAPEQATRTNKSLGAAETQVVRRLNQRVGRRVRRDAIHDALVHQHLAEQHLVARSSSPVRLPPDRYDWPEQQAERWLEWARGAGVHVVGDLEELRPRRPDPDEAWTNPDRVGRKQMLDAAMDALAEMTREASRRGSEESLLDKARGAAGRLRAGG